MATMTAEEAAEAARGLTFEKVWASIQKMSEETGKRIQELSKEHEKWAREQEERSRKLDERLERLAKNVGGLNRSLGELVETLIASRLWEKFSGYGYKLERAYQRVPVFDENNRALTDIDILLSDTILAMAVEVKREPVREDVERHLVRMERIRKYPPAETRDKKLLGALAGGVIDPDVKEYAYRAGFFVLELQGESVALVPPPEGFQPREW